MKSREQLSVCNRTKTIRITQAMDELIKAKALENHTSESEIIKQAILEYMNKNMSDNEIFHASLQEIKHHLYTLENKVKKYPAMYYATMRELFAVMPENPVRTNTQIEYAMDKYKRNVASISASHREGVFETILLDEAERNTKEL